MRYAQWSRTTLSSHMQTLRAWHTQQAIHTNKLRQGLPNMQTLLVVWKNKQETP